MKTKDAYLKEIEEQLKKWQVEIETLENRAGQVDAESRKVHLETVDDLKAKQNAAQVNLKNLKAASEESWEALKTGYESLQQDIEKSIENAHTSIK